MNIESLLEGLEQTLENDESEAHFYMEQFVEMPNYLEVMKFKNTYPQAVLFLKDYWYRSESFFAF